MTILDLPLGRPLASDEARGEQIGSLVGVSVFGLDARSSAAYGPEAPAAKRQPADCGD